MTAFSAFTTTQAYFLPASSLLGSKDCPHFVGVEASTSFAQPSASLRFLEPDNAVSLTYSAHALCEAIIITRAMRHDQRELEVNTFFILFGFKKLINKVILYVLLLILQFIGAFLHLAASKDTNNLYSFLLSLTHFFYILTFFNARRLVFTSIFLVQALCIP